MAESQTTKILKRHMPAEDYRPGEEVELRVDQVLLQDATGAMACLQLEQLSIDEVEVTPSLPRRPAVGSAAGTAAPDIPAR
jgi:aconitate hydratase